MSVITAYVKAFAALGDPSIRRLVRIAGAIAGAILVALWAAAGLALGATAVFEIAWIEALLDALGAVAALALGWLLFPAVASAVVGLFLESVVDAVAARHYPQGGCAAPSFWRGLAASLRLLALAVPINLLLLPLVLLPPVFPFVFLAANGYLLGREYFDLVAQRRLDRGEAEALRKARRGKLWLAGVVGAGLLTLPVVNLIGPVVVTAAMVHLIEAGRRARVAASSAETEGRGCNDVPSQQGQH